MTPIMRRRRFDWRTMEQTPATNPERLAETMWVQEFARWARGDSRLSAWEEQFLTDMARRADRSHGVSVSEKQRTILVNLAKRLEAEPEPEVDGDETDA
jgi:hypothetical protein